MSTVIRIENLHKSFKTGFLLQKTKILRGISLSVEEGEIFGYLGPNGAGKTTTLKCVLGLLFPEEGKIELFDFPHLSLKAKARIGFLPENPYFYDYLTASEFLRFYGQLFLIPSQEKAKKIDSLLKLVDMEKYKNLQLRKFSRGMLQRIGLAQALLNDPVLILLDEPLGGLDPLGRKEIRDIIVRLKEEGKTVFLSSHILQDIEMICDRVAILVGGEIINQGHLQELISTKILFTEIVLSGVEEEELNKLGECLSTHAGQTLLKIFDQEKVDTTLRIIQKKKGTIHSLTPRTETLEDLFVDMVKKG
ncbi:MAG: ABC transporter ATP-binding protein [Candidatus Aminicenantes bacterium]|jgi:ABC-2 type transport system ATP-binding protein